MLNHGDHRRLHYKVVTTVHDLHARHSRQDEWPEEAANDANGGQTSVLFLR